MSDCPFCAMVAPGTPAVFIIEPLNPVTVGHVLFLPRVHVADAAENPRVTAEVMAVASRWAQGRSANLITSIGAAATQSVRHLHIHGVPRADGDGLSLPWTGQEADQ